MYNIKMCKLSINNNDLTISLKNNNFILLIDNYRKHGEISTQISWSIMFDTITLVKFSHHHYRIAIISQTFLDEKSIAILSFIETRREKG